MGLIVLIISYFQPYKLVVICGQSMMPTLKDRQIVIAKKQNIYKKGDVVVFITSDNNKLVKRITYCPDEYFYYYLDSEHASMTLLKDNSYRSIFEAKKEFGKLILENKVQKNHYYLLGDNYDFSEDSRLFGTIDKSDILYKVIL